MNAQSKVLPDLASELRAAQARIAELETKNALRLKVSEKGAISIYGLGRFPVTLYRGQMERLMDYAPTIKEFIRVNQAFLKTKE